MTLMPARCTLVLDLSDRGLPDCRKIDTVSLKYSRVRFDHDRPRRCNYAQLKSFSSGPMTGGLETMENLPATVSKHSANEILNLADFTTAPGDYFLAIACTIIMPRYTDVIKYVRLRIDTRRNKK